MAIWYRNNCMAWLNSRQGMTCCPVGSIKKHAHDRLGMDKYSSLAAAKHDRRKALEDLWT
jgi:hypothetical protein